MNRTPTIYIAIGGAGRLVLEHLKELLGDANQGQSPAEVGQQEKGPAESSEVDREEAEQEQKTTYDIWVEEGGD